MWHRMVTPGTEGGEAAAAGQRARSQRARRLRHDAFNELLAIEAAATLLGQDSLPARERSETAAMLLECLRRLKVLLDEGLEGLADAVTGPPDG